MRGKSEDTNCRTAEEKQLHRPELEEKMHHLNNGVMDYTLVKQANGEDVLEEGSMKKTVGSFLSNWKFEVFIVILVLADLLFTVTECGLDYNWFCVSPEIVPVDRDKIKELEAHPKKVSMLWEGLSYSHNSSKTGSFHSQDRGLRQNDALNGTVMLQVTKSAKTVYVEEEWLNVTDGSKGRAGKGGHDPAKHGHKSVGAPQEGKGGDQVEHTNDNQGGDHAEHAHSATLLCEGPHGERTEFLEHCCHVASLCILGVFLVELATKAWVNAGHFFENSLHVVDLVVVSVSFVIDVTWPFVIARHKRFGELQADVMKVPLLIIRLWRIVRICHGSHEMVQSGLQYVQELKDHIEESEAEIKKLKAEVASRRLF